MRRAEGDDVRILAVDISGVFSQFWEVDSGKGRDFDKPRTATLAAIRRFRDGHDRVAICCDSGKSFRSQIWESYKANRPDRGEAYRTQIRYAIEALEAEGCSVFRAPKYNGDLFAEADDVIGSLCAWSWESGHSVTILSSDKDLLQLVNPQVTMLRPLDQERKVYDEAAVLEKYGIIPAKIPDFLALAGDVSDNYKPYPGIGDKRAVELIKHYGNALAMFEGVVSMADLANILGAKLAESFVAAGPDPARKALEVATIVRDLPLDFERLTGEPAMQRIEIESEPLPKSEPVQTAPVATPVVSMVPTIKPVQAASKSDPFALQPTGQQSLRQFAADAASSRMFPQIATAEQAVVVIAWGQNLGVPAVIALSQAYVVYGRVGWGAQFIAGLVKNNASCIKFYVSETDDEHATVVYQRRGEPEGKYTFRWKDAEKRGLTKPTRSNEPSMWIKFPAIMCRWAAMRECARMVWPDVVTGVYTPDEIAQGELPEEMIATMVSRG